MAPARLRVGAAALAALVLSSCLSVRTRHRPFAGAAQGGGVALRVYADDAARKAAAPGPRGLYVELERRTGAGYTPVFRSLEPVWSVMGLAAGEYRLRFPERLDEAGHVVRLDERPRRVRVRPGKVAEVEAVLDHVNKGLVVAGVVTAVVAAVLLEDWLDDHDLPAPPLLLPAAPEIVDAVFYLTLDATSGEHAPWREAGPASAPVVTSHFPPDGALVAARRVRVTFALSEPLDGGRLRADGVTVLAENAGPVEGVASYDGDRWWVVWESADDLPRDDLLHVTLASDAVADLRGQELAAPRSFTFRTTP